MIIAECRNIEKNGKIIGWKIKPTIWARILGKEIFIDKEMLLTEKELEEKA